MKKKGIIITGVSILAAAVLLAGGYVYMTKPNFRYIDTRTHEKDKGPQYVKVKMDNHETLSVLGNSESGKNIATEIPKEQTWEEKTLEIDQQIQKELANEAYTFEEPLLIQDPYQNSPLTAVAVYSGKDSAKVRVTVKGKDEQTDIIDTLNAADKHIVPIIGLYADTENTVILEELDAKGTVTKTNTLRIQTETLPESLRDIAEVKEKSAETSMQMMVITGGKAPYVYGIDSNGDVRWYLTNKTGATYGGYPLSNGRYLIESEHTLMPTALKPHSAQFHEIDYLGRIYQDYFFDSGVHHELKEKTPDGNLLVVTDSGEAYGQDMIQEYDRKTGALVKELDLKQLFQDTKWITKPDWAHINTLSYDPATDSVIINPRNLHSVIKVNWATDELEWILGNPTLWEGSGLEDKVLQPIGDIQWHYQPHTAYQEATDLDNNPATIHLMLFDNHNDASRKVEGFEKTGSSYVKAYSIDPLKMTVTQDHVYKSPYAGITSNYEFDEESKRVFAVSAYAGTKKKGRYGEITEYEYDSEKKVSRYRINHNFYRGYLMNVNLQSCLGEISTTDPYLKGQLRAPSKVEKKVGKPSKVLENTSEGKIELSLLKDILMVSADDHSFTQIIFSGKKNTYVYDISDIKKRLNVSFTYAIPIPLSSMNADTYEIYTMTQNEYYSLNQSFTISE